MSTTLDSALLLGEHGIHVVRCYGLTPDGNCTCHKGPACKSPGKHPSLGAGWRDKATTDSGAIYAWFRDGASNLGIVLGQRSNLIDVEFDDDEGRATADQLLNGIVTPSYSSGRSVHRLFRWNNDLPKKAVGKVRGMEVRTGASDRSAQSIAPPSRHHSGKLYQWLPGLSLAEVEIAPLPDSVLGLAWAAHDADAGKDLASDVEVARDALAALSPARADDYELWLKVGMALKATDDGLLPDWDAWSRCSPKYEDGATSEKWGSFSRNGVSIGSLIHWARQDSPGWRPPRRQAMSVHTNGAPAGGPTSQRIINARVFESDEGEKTEPLRMDQILSDIRAATGDWPRRVANSLFVRDGGEGVSWIDKTPALMGWLGSVTGQPPLFHRKPSCHSAAEVFAEMQRTATAYRAVEVIPHEPLIEGHYYACPTPSAGDGDHLRELIGRFAPETAIDADLMLAAMVTPFWGGAGGTRPAFVITADAGRGSGKTRFVSMIGQLAGGMIELSANEDAAVMKQRLLSPEGLSKRIALLDNLKTLRFSWSELEAMITAPVVSGKRLYVGEGQRPNNLVFFITLNGVSLATDMAQRSVVIKLRRPKFSATWEEDTRQYIESNREAIIGDIIGFLRSPRSELDQHTRWGAWERDILSRLPEPSDAQQVIRERQAVADVESEEAGIIEDFFAQQLEMFSYNPTTNRVFIPSSVAARWFGWATNEKLTVTSVSRTLNQKIKEGAISRLAVNNGRTLGRGFIWSGECCSPEDRINPDLEARIHERERRG